MEWKISTEPVDYEEAVACMEARVQAIRKCEAEELVWLLEHPALYTAGTGAKEIDLLDTFGLPVFSTGRGGQYTYHGPGQRIAYVMLDLKKRNPDVRWFVQSLEAWIIATLSSFGVESFTREGRVGVWVDTGKARMHGGVFYGDPAGELARSEIESGAEPNKNEEKIAALGVRIRKWVTYHGVSVNLNPNLTHYRGIVPCGIREYGITSLEQLGISASVDMFDERLIQCFGDYFDWF